VIQPGLSFEPDVTRSKAVRLALFNHKGGVGKTTLTVNIADALARQGSRILLVDSDPQCNLTSYYLPDNRVDRLLTDSDGEKGRTLWSALRPVFESAGPAKIVPPGPVGTENVFLIPGDIQMSKFETELEDLWHQCFERKVRGFNGTIALSKLVNAISGAYNCDFVFYDCGPNVGALNRAILLDADYFIVPGACDSFSIRALTTLGIQLQTWITDWRTVNLLVPKGVYKLPGQSRLLGYILQRFRTYRKMMATQYAHYATLFESELKRNIYEVLNSLDPELTPIPVEKLRIGAVYDFGQRALQAQEVGIPLDSIGTMEQKDEARRLFRTMARRVVNLIKGEE